MPLEHLAPVALEAAGQVADAARRAAPARTASRPARRIAASAPQFSIAAAVDVARAEHEVGVAGGRDQPRHVVRVVGEVAVHLEHELGAVGERAAEAGEVRGPEALLRRRGGARRPAARSAASRSASSPVPSGELSSITSTRSSGPSRSSSARDHRLEVLALVVGGEADGGPGHAAYDRGKWRLPRNAEVIDQLELLADMLELEGTGGVPRARLPARGAADRARPAARSPSSRSTARRRSSRGSARRSRRRSSRSSRQGEIEALTKRREPDPARRGRLHAAARPRAEDGAPDLAGARRDHARRAARGGRAASGCGR